MASFQDLDDDRKKEVWSCLALRHAWGIGPSRGASLIEAYGSAYQATREALRDSRAWVRRKLASGRAALEFARETWRKSAMLEWEAMQHQDCCFLLCNEPGYPAILRETSDYPLILYYKGNPSFLNGPAIGVVGSRQCTNEGLAVSAFFSRGLSQAGVSVVSGMAKGIDRAAHLAALEGPGSSIAVTGTGIDVVYPPENADLAELLASKGLIISEFPPGTEARAGNFPIRNRLISGLCRGVLVVEAAARSGSLITSRLALEQGRDVFAVPGHTMSSNSEGCRELIRNGAKPVFSADDILEELAGQLSQEAVRALEVRARERLNKTRTTGMVEDINLTDYDTAEEVLPPGGLPWRAPSRRKGRNMEAPGNVLAQPTGSSVSDASAGRQPPVFLPQPENLSPAGASVLSALSEGPLHIDDLARMVGSNISELSSLLLMLELEGLVRKLPGMRYSRAADGKGRA